MVSSIRHLSLYVMPELWQLSWDHEGIFKGRVERLRLTEQKHLKIKETSNQIVEELI